MKYTKDEAFDEVLRRGEKMKIQNKKKKMKMISASAIFVLAAAVISVGWITGSGGVMSGQSAYGSFLLPAQAGGYILATVIAFVAGVGVTVGIQKYRKDRRK